MTNNILQIHLEESPSHQYGVVLNVFFGLQQCVSQPLLLAFVGGRDRDPLEFVAVLVMIFCVLLPTMTTSLSAPSAAS